MAFRGRWKEQGTAVLELAQAVKEEDTTKIQRIIVDEHIPVNFREPKYFSLNDLSIQSQEYDKKYLKIRDSLVQIKNMETSIII
jgi:hypothetical protein